MNDEPRVRSISFLDGRIIATLPAADVREFERGHGTENLAWLCRIVAELAANYFQQASGAVVKGT